MTTFERKHEWQEVSRVYLTELDKNVNGSFQDKLDQLKRIHGDDARIEMDSYLSDTAVNLKVDVAITTKTTTYFKVMKYLPVSTYMERLASFDQASSKQNEISMSTHLQQLNTKKKKNDKKN